MRFSTSQRGESLRNRSRGALILIGLALAMGCQTRQSLPDSRNVEGAEAEKLVLNRVVVLPVVNMFAIYGAGASYSCSLCGRSFIIGDVGPGAEEFLTHEITAKLRDRKSFEVVSPDEALGVQSELMDKSQTEFSELELLQAVGKALDADAVLLPRVYRFVELEGSKFSAKSPASVTLSLLLVNSQDGRLLWEGHFTETQKSLFENLFDFKTFFNRDMKWLTAEELAVYGIQNILERFPVE